MNSLGSRYVTYQAVQRLSTLRLRAEQQGLGLLCDACVAVAARHPQVPRDGEPARHRAELHRGARVPLELRRRTTRTAAACHSNCGGAPVLTLTRWYLGAYRAQVQVRLTTTTRRATTAPANPTMSTLCTPSTTLTRAGEGGGLCLTPPLLCLVSLVAAISVNAVKPSHLRPALAHPKRHNIEHSQPVSLSDCNLHLSDRTPTVHQPCQPWPRRRC